jgi:DNA-binding response OmpR family regulator
LSGPLSRRELAARIGAMFDRRHAFKPAEPRYHAYHVGALAIDLRAHAVTKDGRSLFLTPTEFRLLVALARRAGKVVSHAELLSEVWGTTLVERPEVVQQCIRYLRRKLGDAPKQPRLIQSRRGVGYRLAEVGP